MYYIETIVDGELRKYPVINGSDTIPVSGREGQNINNIPFRVVAADPVTKLFILQSATVSVDGLQIYSPNLGEQIMWSERAKGRDVTYDWGIVDPESPTCLVTPFLGFHNIDADALIWQPGDGAGIHEALAYMSRSGRDVTMTWQFEVDGVVYTASQTYSPREEQKMATKELRFEQS